MNSDSTVDQSRPSFHREHSHEYSLTMPILDSCQNSAKACHTPQTRHNADFLGLSQSPLGQLLQQDTFPILLGRGSLPCFFSILGPCGPFLKPKPTCATAAPQHTHTQVLWVNL